MRPFLILTLVVSFAISACKPEISAEEDSLALQIAETEKANRFFDSTFDAMTARSPMYQSYLGIKDQQNEWDNLSDKYAQETIQLVKKNLAYLQENIDYNKLDEQTQLSYKIFVDDAEKKIEAFPWRFHSYPVNPQEGLHTEVPTMLINVHQVENLYDLKDYIARLKKVKPLFDELIISLKIREEKRIIPPLFVYPKVIAAAQNVISGAPFNANEKDAPSLKPSPIYGDFLRKINELEGLSQTTKDSLTKEASTALITSVKPAYENLIRYLSSLEKKATTTVGAWSWPQGDEYYQMAVKHYTTTDMSPEEVFQLGQKEVARIHNEMRKIMKQVNFKSDNIEEFFRYVTTDKQFYYSNTEEGRQAYLKANTDYIENMKNSLDRLFLTKPKADIEVRAVEKFRESSAGTAFYERPAPDGSRPGIFYANLSDMSQSPIYQIEALAYHEGIPGHHMQIAISQELTGVPKFRRFGSYTAYIEGWGLYSELVPKEIGYYKDPYSDFGRLSMELLRAARLVVDPGIHYKKWTREEAIEYFRKNTAEPAGEVVNAIERYIVWPGQATAYKIGMNKILELRQKASDELGLKFNIREFHDVILLSGPVPLNLLEENVSNWINSKKG